jgi:hypothetical protein
VALRNGDAVDHLVLLEDGVNLDRLLEETVAELDLVSDTATVDLNLHQVSLLLLEWCLADLSVCEHADHRTVLLDTLELAGEVCAFGFGVSLGVLGEGLLLRPIPVLVEAALELVGKMFSPDCGEGAETARGFDVADEADDDHLLLV